MNDTIPVTIDGEPRDVTLPDFFDQLKYNGYKTNRHIFPSAEAAMVFYVKEGVGNLHDVQRWENRYVAELAIANASKSCHDE